MDTATLFLHTLNVSGVNIKVAVGRLNSNNNTVGLLLNDESTAQAVRNMLKNLHESSRKLNDDLEALQHNFLLRVILEKRKKHVNNKHMNLPATMQAMILNEPKTPLVYSTLPVPVPGAGQVLIKVIACGICRTDLHVVDGELANPKLPLIPGHEIVGTVVITGEQVVGLKEGDVVGIPWLGYTCGACSYCLKGQENLCDNAGFTGYTIDGGYAEYTVANAKYCFRLAQMYANASGAPLLCAGLIGYRSYNMISGNAKNIGLYGFGAAAHILIQVAIHQHKNVYAFTSRGDVTAQQFALSLGAVWAGDSSQNPPVKLDAAIIFAPVGALVPKALQDTCKGGEVICGGIHMSDIPSFPYDILWGERVLRSVANLTRNDGDSFLTLAPQVPVKTQTQLFKLFEANEALDALRSGNIQGAAVLVMA